MTKETMRRKGRGKKGKKKGEEASLKPDICQVPVQFIRRNSEGCMTNKLQSAHEPNLSCDLTQKRERNHPHLHRSKTGCAPRNEEKQEELGREEVSAWSKGNSEQELRLKKKKLRAMILS